MPVIAKVPVLLSVMLPLPLFVALKLVIVLALFKNVPPVEVVLSKVPLIFPDSVNAPFVVTDSVPLEVSVVVGNERPAFVKVIVRLASVPEIGPPKVSRPVPVPTMVVVLCDCNRIGLFNVSLLPTIESAPPLL